MKVLENKITDIRILNKSNPEGAEMIFRHNTNDNEYFEIIVMREGSKTGLRLPITIVSDIEEALSKVCDIDNGIKGEYKEHE